MVVSSKDFLDLVELAKNIKCDIVYINGNTIFGVDDSFATLKKATINNPCNIFVCYRTLDMREFIKNIDSDRVQIDNNSIRTSIDNIVYQMSGQVVMNIMDLANRIVLMTYTDLYNMKQPDYINEDIRQDINFENILAMKSADGAARYIADNKYILTLFNGLLPINKKDKVSLKIYNIDIYKFLANFTIVKKGISMDIFIMYRHM